jgi:formate dehydrogenase beta subunit
MPADAVEIHDAEEEKVKFEYLVAPKRVLAEDNKVVGLECIRMELGAPDESGRRRPVPIEGSEYVVDCDIVIPAIGQRVNIALVEGVEDLELTPWHTFVVDEVTKQTSRPKLFSAGDCETGPGALITACAGGRKAARSIHRLINGEDLVQEGDDDAFDQLFRSVKIYDPEEPIGAVGTMARQQLAHLDPALRKTSFDEVEQGFSVPQAQAEAFRCLRCYCVATVAL